MNERLSRILLTDEEIIKAEMPAEEKPSAYYVPLFERDIAIAQAQKLVRWLEAVEAREYDQGVLWHCIRDKDWQVLKREVEAE